MNSEDFPFPCLLYLSTNIIFYIILGKFKQIKVFIGIMVDMWKKNWEFALRTTFQSQYAEKVQLSQTISPNYVKAWTSTIQTEAEYSEEDL